MHNILKVNINKIRINVIKNSKNIVKIIYIYTEFNLWHC